MSQFPYHDATKLKKSPGIEIFVLDVKTEQKLPWDKCTMPQDKCAMPWDKCAMPPGTSVQCPGTSVQCPRTSRQCPRTSRQCPGTSRQCPRTSRQCPGTAGIETQAGHSERPRTTSRTSRGHLRMSRENQTHLWDVPQTAQGWPWDVLGWPRPPGPGCPGMALGHPGMARGLPGCPGQPPLKT